RSFRVDDDSSSARERRSGGRTITVRTRGLDLADDLEREKRTGVRRSDDPHRPLDGPRAACDGLRINLPGPPLTDPDEVGPRVVVAHAEHVGYASVVGESADQFDGLPQHRPRLASAARLDMRDDQAPRLLT